MGKVLPSISAKLLILVHQNFGFTLFTRNLGHIHNNLFNTWSPKLWIHPVYYKPGAIFTTFNIIFCAIGFEMKLTCLSQFNTDRRAEYLYRNEWLDAQIN
jgi:hypothetical protein